MLSRNTMFRGEAVPFVMELPNYRMPGIKNVLRLLWDKAKDFLQRAFTVIFIASIVIWILQTFDFHFNYISESQASILAAIAGFIARYSLRSIRRLENCHRSYSRLLWQRKA